MWLALMWTGRPPWQQHLSSHAKAPPIRQELWVKGAGEGWDGLRVLQMREGGPVHLQQHWSLPSLHAQALSSDADLAPCTPCAPSTRSQNRLFCSFRGRQCRLKFTHRPVWDTVSHIPQGQRAVGCTLEDRLHASPPSQPRMSQSALLKCPPFFMTKQNSTFVTRGESESLWYYGARRGGASG